MVINSSGDVGYNDLVSSRFEFFRNQIEFEVFNVKDTFFCTFFDYESVISLIDCVLNPLLLSWNLSRFGRSLLYPFRTSSILSNILLRFNCCHLNFFSSSKLNFKFSSIFINHLDWLWMNHSDLGLPTCLFSLLFGSFVLLWRIWILI